MSEEVILSSNLKSISINRLYEGMYVSDDIYDADASRLIVKSGVTLDYDDIERIKNLNAKRSTIFVSAGTFMKLAERDKNLENEKREEMEKSTGYTKAVEDAFELFDDIEYTNTISASALQSVSADLSYRLEVTTPGTILSLINALAPVDEYLQRHCVDVSLLNGLFGRWLDMPKRDIDELILIGLLHDCGKALVPSEILNAPRKLTVAEFEVMKMHAVYTYDLLNEFEEPIRLAAAGHHEKINGRGYPDRLTLPQIPLAARITAISDVYDAMVSQRVYKPPRSPFNIMAVLLELKDKELDAELVDLFVQNMPNELIGKEVKLSDGSICTVHSCDYDDIEYPMLEKKGNIFKSNKELYCVSMC